MCARKNKSMKIYDINIYVIYVCIRMYRSKIIILRSVFSVES